VLDAQGNLYGITYNGGTSDYGTVFKVDTTGTETVLHSFAGSGAGDGQGPSGGVVLDPQGNLYGTTAEGGAHCTQSGFAGCGTVFKIDAAGKETVLYSFAGKQGKDGQLPDGGVVLDPQGNLYGTTSGGGVYCAKGDLPGCGTVFKIDNSGTETVLHSFAGRIGNDGKIPGGVVLNLQGNLFGTTFYGGDGRKPGCLSGCGTVFEVDASGNETVLYTFNGKTGEGDLPSPPLSRDLLGNLYGTTFSTELDEVGYGNVFALLSPASATTTTLTSSRNPSTCGQPVTFAAVVRGEAGTPHDGETVKFMNAKTLLGTGTLSGGSATFTTSSLRVGGTKVTAVYGGDTQFVGSTSNVVKQVVKK